MDLYLKFPNKETADSVLYTDEVPNYRNIDVIGFIYEGGQWDEEGNEIIAPTQVEGWHVNLRVVDPEFDVSSLEVFCIHPQQPVCIWA